MATTLRETTDSYDSLGVGNDACHGLLGGDDEQRAAEESIGLRVLDEPLCNSVGQDNWLFLSAANWIASV